VRGPHRTAGEGPALLAGRLFSTDALAVSEQSVLQPEIQSQEISRLSEVKIKQGRRSFAPGCDQINRKSVHLQPVIEKMNVPRRCLTAYARDTNNQIPTIKN
jgi:hypothetical protein